MTGGEYLLFTGIALYLVVAPQAEAFYNPHTGRWLSRDPAAEKGGPNLSGFIKNNPVNSFDPSGLCPCRANEQSTALVSKPTREASCASEVIFTISAPKVMNTWAEAEMICGSSKQQGFPTPACALPVLSFHSECKRCGCDYKIVMKVRGNCSIYILDETKVAWLTYVPNHAAVVTHEACHCNDYYEVLLKMMTLYNEMTYPNKERCEETRAIYDRTFRQRFDDNLPGHLLPKYRERGDCYAEWTTQ